MVAKIGVFHLRYIFFRAKKSEKHQMWIVLPACNCFQVFIPQLSCKLYDKLNCRQNINTPFPPSKANLLHLLLLAPLVQLRDMYLDHTSQPHPSLFLLLILIQPASPLPLLLVVHSSLGCFLLGVQLHLAVHGH